MARKMTTGRVGVSRERATQWFTLMRSVAVEGNNPSLAINLMTRSHRIAVSFIAAEAWDPHVTLDKRN
jgi:hypothetical protein